MKIVVSGAHDWLLYLMMFALSAAAHTALVFIVFMVEPSSAIEGQIVSPGEIGSAQSIADALTTWKSRLSGREDSMKGDLDGKMHKLEENPAAQLDAAWTRENMPDKLEELAGMVGTDLRMVRLEKATSGKMNVHVELKSDPSKVLDDLAFVSRLVGVVSKKASFPSDRLVVDVYGTDQASQGHFELSTQATRDLAGGRMTLKELFDEGLRPS